MSQEVWAFVLVSIPTMVVLGMRHALDVDHITAIDNLVRLHNAVKKSRWVGAGFSAGHMASVLAEMIFIIYVVGSITNADSISLWGGVVGATALGSIGAINLVSMKKWGKTSSAILASRILCKTGMARPIGSALVTGLVFGLGFDTATQISAITLSAVASATAGVQVALVLAGFFAAGMVPVDTFDSVLLRTAFHRIFNTKAFRYMSYALSIVALTVASLQSYSILAKVNLLPAWIGAALAASIVGTAFAYAFFTRNNPPSRLAEKHIDKRDLK